MTCGPDPLEVVYTSPHSGSWARPSGNPAPHLSAFAGAQSESVHLSRLQAVSHQSAHLHQARFERNPGLEQWVLLAVLLVAPFLAVTDGFIVTLALPSIQLRLRTNDAEALLVVAAYILAYASLLVTGGRLGDLYGRRRLLVIGMATFGATSLMGAAAPNGHILIIARLSQGASAALMYPQALGQIQVLYRGPDRAIATSAFGGALGVASVVAPVLGGIIVQANLLGLTWRPIFLVNVPVTAAGALLTVLLVPESTAGPAAERLDLLGAAMLALGLLAIVLPLTLGRQFGWPSWTWVLLSVGAVDGTLFAVQQGLSRAPLVDLSVIRLRAFVLGLLTTLLVYGGQASFFVLLTLYVQRGLGLSPMPAGLLLATVAVGFAAAAIALPRVGRKVGTDVLTAGALILSVSTSALAILAERSAARALVTLPAVLFVVGVGFGLVIPHLVATVLKGVPSERAGAVSGVLLTAQQLAGVLGVAASGVFFFGLLPLASSYAFAFAVALSLNVALFLCSAIVMRGLRHAS